jgi:predicted nucleotidyltransferase
MADLLKQIRAAEFPFTDQLIHLFVGGSELHGAKVHDTDDLDVYGVYIEPPEMLLGLEALPHFVWSSAGDERRNGPDGVDVTLYSLRKWMTLACKGNPAALHFLFSGNSLRHSSWADVLSNKDLFLARSSAKQFIGFADDQLKRMTGEKGRGKKGHRTELEEKYGYDVKAAMHGLRLLYECKELLSEGRVTLPRPERALLVRVRTGKYAVAEVSEMAKVLFVECREAADLSILPASVDRDAVSKLATTCYLNAWNSC